MFVESIELASICLIQYFIWENVRAHVKEFYIVTFVLKIVHLSKILLYLIKIFHF
jgi:hypothetical protein